MSTQHCGFKGGFKHNDFGLHDHHFFHHQHHSCGCKGFKHNDFGLHDHHFFHHQHHSCSCKGFKHNDFGLHDHQFFHHQHHSCGGCKDFKHNDFLHDHHCLCDDRFRFRLSGLRSSMAFRFRQLIGERVKVALEEEKIVQGKIIFVGNDFIEIVVKVKKEKHKHEFKKKVFLVQFDEIKWVERLDNFC
ncbi:hypothetical protein L2D08_14395 [Domibacillus sp. PGB-M46]|uniref:hypothetical protein n=1 Tax=Domibacillus sp. PGB-M46 TaxID=2910255 RepID=UPI001F5A839D|nr:hypothetical protein [Domibacillus sp. PGB-M46]MCI2255560.1 hypothetical protein [Domibacillus sp. PGB-M46]